MNFNSCLKDNDVYKQKFNNSFIYLNPQKMRQ